MLLLQGANKVTLEDNSDLCKMYRYLVEFEHSDFKFSNSLKPLIDVLQQSATNSLLGSHKILAWNREEKIN